MTFSPELTIVDRAAARIVAVPSSPIAMPNCKSGGNAFKEFANMTNQTSHGMLSVTIQWRYYDGENTAIGIRARTTAGTLPMQRAPARREGA